VRPKSRGPSPLLIEPVESTSSGGPFEDGNRKGRLSGNERMSVAAIITIGCFAALVFDLLGATASRWLGFQYSRLAPGSYALYTATSVVAAHVGPFWIGIVAGATVAFVEATIGWAISWRIGPGRPPASTSLSRTRIMRVVGIVTMTGAAFGLLGAIFVALRP
jgi:hypothetical protein